MAGEGRGVTVSCINRHAFKYSTFRRLKKTIYRRSLPAFISQDLRSILRSQTKMLGQSQMHNDGTIRAMNKSSF